ncbi:replicative DNA helicase [Maribellus sediminis]|uniref:replicative DNA helicase n=1 Tax=Maribellus sediminis TaxID=2696285 RepID=UPI001430D3C1|nr:replicative DNA helicase [Maribellus sediminis]
MERFFGPYEKIPPQALDVEAAVLGALLLENDALETVLSIIDTPCFYLDTHQKIFDTIKVVASKMPVDLLTVTQELKDLELLDRIGGPGYLVQLTRHVASAANIESHARIIAEMYYKRESIIKASEIITICYQGKDVELISQLWKRSSEGLEDIFTVANSGSLISLVLKDTLGEIEKDCMRLKEKHSPGIPCGFPSLDRSTGGWRNGDLSILAARPGVGKSSFSLHFALRAAYDGRWVNIFSFEMRKEDLMRIKLATVSSVYRSKIRDGQLDDSDWKQINVAAGNLENLPIIYSDAAGMTIEQVYAIVRNNHKHGRCDFVILDYLQLVKPGRKVAIREQEVSEVSRALKIMALTLNIPVLALSQLNRAADGETPKLSQLRESGAIEQDADNILFLHRPEDDVHKIRLTLAKHRRGQLGDIDIYSNSQFTRFSENPGKFQ